MNLYSTIEEIPRIGPFYVKKLRRLGIENIRDLLFYFPARYENFSNIVSISDVKLNETCCVKGQIMIIDNVRTWKRKMFLTEAIIKDKTGAIKAIWFNQPYLKKTLKAGETVCLAGKLVLGNKSGAYLSNPIYEKIDAKDDLTHTGRIIPVYPETERVSSRWIRSILKPILTAFKDKIPESLPKEIIEKEKFLPISRAIWQIHFPDSADSAKTAQNRFAFEGLFLIEILVLKEKFRIAKEKAAAIPLNLPLIQKLVKSLPFNLTDAQKKSAWQIFKDMEKPKPMNRLLEGDVGSGKTVVAAMAILNAVKAGHQAAVMAPTEILAKQHFQGISRLLKNFKLSIALLTGKEDKIMAKKLENEILEISRRKILEKSLNGEIDVLIGTHALIQDKVKFKDLALVIVDEQHRFGIEQRRKLAKKSNIVKIKQSGVQETQEASAIPHLLSMTATPIPRTLALTIYGDLDLSLIDEMPKGRKKIITKVVSPKDRQKAYDFIRNEVKNKKQVFVICPRIEAAEFKDPENRSGWNEVKAVKQEYEKLSKEIFPDLEIGILHGKMKTKEKEKIMRSFKIGKIDILVSTSVVEVGIDIPNATVMMIEGAERFGLAQLHQFRGRVGRNEWQSYCFLFADSPSKNTIKRLKALVTCKNGFELAEKDLEIRGPGELFGIKQWGVPDLAMNALKDILLVEKTRTAAKEILENDPRLNKYPLLKECVKKMKIHLE